MKLGIISSHAKMRMRRAGISEQALRDFLAGGKVEHGRHGGRIVHFDAADKTRPGPARTHYAVLDSQGEVITIGQHFSRIRAGNECRRNLRI